MLIKNKKKLFFIGIMLLIPILLPLFTTIIEILFSLGQYFGSIARSVSSI